MRTSAVIQKELLDLFEVTNKIISIEIPSPGYPGLVGEKEIKLTMENEVKYISPHNYIRTVGTVPVGIADVYRVLYTDIANKIISVAANSSVSDGDYIAFFPNKLTKLRTSFFNNVETLFSKEDFPVCVIDIASRTSYPNSTNKYIPGEVEILIMILHSVEKDNIMQIRNEAEIAFTDIMQILNKKLAEDPAFQNTIWGKEKVVLIACTIYAE